MKKYLGCVSLPKKAVPENFQTVVQYYEFSAENQFAAEITLDVLFSKDYLHVPWIKKFLAQFRFITDKHDLVYEVVEV